MSIARASAGPLFDHLDRMTDSFGLFEHARYDRPRPEHGYCVDDVARALVVICHEPTPSVRLRSLGRHYLDFTIAALDPSGTCRNRMTATGRWVGEPELGDWWGRAIWGLGVAAAHAPTQAMRARALFGFRLAAQQRSPHPRAMAFAGLGAGELLQAAPGEGAAVALLADSAAALEVSALNEQWRWPESRLTYGNGSVAEAMLLAGSTLAEPKLVEKGLQWLDFLLTTETRDGHLSVTPVAGRGKDADADRGADAAEAGFDQQPIEVAAIADACARAFSITADDSWLRGVQMAWAWFLGDNDNGTTMFDPHTGGGFDGLQRVGCNLNQGAESTLAMLSTAQLARTYGMYE